MPGDIRGLLNTIRGNYSDNPETSVARGRNIVLNNLGLILLILAFLGMAGILQLPDFVLLSIYSAIPLILEPSYLIEFLPLVGRALPRATVLIDLWSGIATVSLGISMVAVFRFYQFIGAFDMGISWYQAGKSEDE